MNTSKLRHTLAAVIGALAVVGPQLMNLLGEWKSPKAAVVLSALGFLVALAINGKAVALLNLVLPEAPQPQDPPRDKQSGHARPEALVAAICFGLMFAIVSVLFAGKARSGWSSCRVPEEGIDLEGDRR